MNVSQYVKISIDMINMKTDLVTLIDQITKMVNRELQGEVIKVDMIEGSTNGEETTPSSGPTKHVMVGVAHNGKYYRMLRMSMHGEDKFDLIYKEAYNALLTYLTFSTEHYMQFNRTSQKKNHSIPISCDVYSMMKDIKGEEIPYKEIIEE